VGGREVVSRVDVAVVSGVEVASQSRERDVSRPQRVTQAVHQAGESVALSASHVDGSFDPLPESSLLVVAFGDAGRSADERLRIQSREVDVGVDDDRERRVQLLERVEKPAARALGVWVGRVVVRSREPEFADDAVDGAVVDQ
jgi:hypothetical protein